MPAIQSTMLASADYDPTSQTLEVTFRSGETWTYSSVPESEYDGLMGAHSPGRYFLSNIRGVYSAKQS